MKKYVIAKNEYIGFRTSKEIKQILQKLAGEGYRTLSQQCEMVMVEWLKEQGYLNRKQKNNS